MKRLKLPKKVKNHRRPIPKNRRKISKMNALKKAIVDTFYEYTESTEVNGMWLLCKDRPHGIFRWIWSTVLFLLFILGGYLSIRLWLKFYSVPTLITIAENLDTTDVAFPGITICNPQTVIEKKIHEFVEKIELPPQYTYDDIVSGLTYLDVFTIRHQEEPNVTLFEIADALLELNNLTVYQAILEISAGCQDFLQYCFWGTTEFPCHQNHEYLAFAASTSHLGPCCSFNYNPTNHSYKPFSSNLFGVNGGLTLVGLEGTGSDITTGLILYVHHPKDFAVETASSVNIKPNSESFVEISPTEQSSSKEVIELKREKRNCLVSSDVDLQFYRQASCKLACQTEAIYKTCGCHPYHLPIFNKENKARDCQLRDAFCYISNYDSFKTVKCEHCLPNCYDVTYSVTSYFTDLMQHEYSVESFYKDYNLSNEYFLTRIYLSKQSVPSSRKIIVMSWMSLLSDIGGVYSLCLGISMVSVVEFFYFFTFRLYRHYLTHKAIIHGK